MAVYWTLWVLVAIIGGFALGESYALATGRMTLSRLVWTISARFPPFPWIAGVVTGFLAAHFWWACQGCPL